MSAWAEFFWTLRGGLLPKLTGQLLARLTGLCQPNATVESVVCTRSKCDLGGHALRVFGLQV